MSFYGSVYYQLLDAFNKIVIQNNGSNKGSVFNTKLDTVGTVEAKGRKSTFSLDTGNRWVTFSAEPSAQSAGDDENSSTVYKIWHSKPDTNAKNKIGFYYEGETDKTGSSSDDPIILKENDLFYTYNHVIDEAGHVVVDTKKVKKTYYRLPQSETNNRVETLEEYIGTPAKTLPHDGIENLFDYAEKAYDNINTQQSYIGNWTKIADKYNDFKPTVQSVIGDMDNLFKDETYKKYNGQNLVSVLGD